jgi:hypothetical protein
MQCFQILNCVYAIQIYNITKSSNSSHGLTHSVSHRLSRSHQVNDVELVGQKERALVMLVRDEVRRVRAKWVLSCLLVFSVALPNGRVSAQDPDPDGPLIEAKDVAEIPEPNLRTAEQMAQADLTALAPLVGETSVVPFMPTIDPATYRAAKNGASALSPVPEKPVTQPTAPLGPVPIVGNFEGVNQTSAGGARPPDTEGAVGHTQFVEVVNRRVVVYNKITGIPGKSTALGAFFGTSESIFDPRVVYDRDWQRWVLVATRKSTSSTDTVRRFFLAVSKTPNAAGDYNLYSVSFGGPAFNNGDWWDFPMLGIDQDSILVTGDIFDTPTGPFKFAALLSVAKARVYNNNLPFNLRFFTGLVGTLAPPIVRDQNPATFLIAAPPNSNALRKYTLRDSSRVPATLSGPVNIPVPAYSIPRDARQFGTPVLLDTSDGRFVNASTQIGNNLWQVHTIALGTFPAPKFYQINTATNTVTTSGFFIASPSLFNHSDDWNASIAANDLNQAIATWSSTNRALQINAQIRVTSGPSGAGTVLFTSPTFYNPSTDNPERWGDYSAVTIDPVLQNHAWLVNEKINSHSVWGSRFGHVTFP